MRPIRIFLVGSFRQQPAETFNSASRRLATALADHARQFIICSVSERTVDRHALHALKEEASASSVLFVHPQDPDSYDDGPELAHLKREMLPLRLESMEVAGGWRAAHLKALRECDVVIALGGSERGTSTVIYSADVLGKPIVLVPTFDGAAERAWRDFARYYTDDERDKLQANPEGPTWATDTASAALSIYHRNPFSKDRLAPVLGTVALLACAVGGWLTVQWNLSRIDPYLTLVSNVAIGLWSAALVGVVIGERGRIGRFHLTDFANIAVLSLAIAFSTLMLSELASFLLSGKTTMFVLALDEARGVLVRLSPVALLAGAVAEGYLDRVLAKAKESLL